MSNNFDENNNNNINEFNFMNYFQNKINENGNELNQKKIEELKSNLKSLTQNFDNNNLCDEVKKNNNNNNISNNYSNINKNNIDINQILEGEKIIKNLLNQIELEEQMNKILLENFKKSKFLIYIKIIIYRAKKNRKFK